MRTPIVKDFESIVDSMRLPGSDKPYYDYGHRLEIANKLTEKDKTNDYKYKKYPLIALRLDTQETLSNGLIAVSLNIALLTMTDEKYTAQQRYDKVFIPVLYPMLELFFKKIKRSGIYFWDAKAGMEYPEVKILDRPYWGTPDKEANKANIFNDPIDAIELIDLKLNKRINKC